jgi:hypothetical protein
MKTIIISAAILAFAFGTTNASIKNGLQDLNITISGGFWNGQLAPGNSSGNSTGNSTGGSGEE